MDFQGSNGADFLNGRASDDLLYGFAGDDTLMGRGGHDVLAAHEGDDSLAGGAGDDYLLGGLGNDTIHGGAGVDWAAYEDATAAVTADLRASGLQHTGGAGVDKLIGIENLYGSAFNDHLFGDDAKNFLSGGAGDDTIYGHGGDDHLEGGAGNDHLDGGAGYDVVSYDGDFAVTVSLKNGVAYTESPTGGVLSQDRLVSIEDVYGSNFDDHIYGDGQSSYLYGSGGEDYLSSGEGGDDVIDGGSGGDFINIHLSGGNLVVHGGEGLDEIAFSPAPGSAPSMAGGQGVRLDLGATGPQEVSDNTFVTISSIEEVTGTAGNDTIFASEAANQFRLDSGDLLVFRSIDEIGLGETGDMIMFMSNGVQVDVSAIDANVLVEGHQTFEYLGAANFTGNAGEITLNESYPGLWTLAFDVNGDAVADAQIITFSPPLVSDFLIL